jgi:hypothetical protein
MKTAKARGILMAALVVCIGLSLSSAYGGDGPSNVRGSVPEKVYRKLTSVFPTAKWWVVEERAGAHGLTEYILEMKIGALELKVTMDSTGKIVATRSACHGEGHATERKGHDNDHAGHGEHGEHGESGGKSKDIFAGGDKVGVEWDGTVWYLDSDPEKLFVNSDGDLEWTPEGRHQFVTNIPTQCLSHVGDVVEKSYMFMSDGEHECEDCLKCPDSCFDDDITCLAGTSDIRVGLFQSIVRSPDSDGYKGFKGYNFRFGPNMMAGPTRLKDCTDEVHKTGMFAKKPVNRSDFMSRNAGLMGRIPGFELKPGRYSYFSVKLERIAADSVLMSITLNDRTITYLDDSSEDQAEKIDVFAVSMRNKRPFTRLVLRSLEKGSSSK